MIRLQEELQGAGYSGGYSILAQRLRELRARPAMQSLAQARADGDFESRQQLITLRDQLTAQAAKVGLRLDSGFRFVPARE